MSSKYEWKATKVSGKNIGIEEQNLSWQTDNQYANLKEIIASTLGSAVTQARAWRKVDFEFDVDDAGIRKGTEDDFDVIYRDACYHLHRTVIESK